MRAKRTTLRTTLRTAWVRKLVRKKADAGLTLVEVLVSLLILTTGVAGVAATQTMGLKAMQSSYYRTQSDLLLGEMADRIRANAGQRNLYVLAFAEVPGGVTACASGCVNYDLSQWQEKISDKLPLGQGRIQAVPAADGVSPTQFEITIRWQDRFTTRDANACAGGDVSNPELTYCMELKIEV